MINVQPQDGYIKFDCHLATEMVVIPSELYIPLNYWRNELWLRNLIGVSSDGIGYGNISVKVPQSDRFYISGTATGGIDRLDQRHYPLVEQCNPALNEIWCRGLIKASAESMSHAAIYSANSEVGAVVHIHNRQLWEKYLEVLPSTAKEVEYGTPEMAYEISRIMSHPETLNRRVIVMGGHLDGIISFGKTVEEAAKAILALEDKGLEN
jgi:L-ribulose-5-phosphate 4-epimerase